MPDGRISIARVVAWGCLPLGSVLWAVGDADGLYVVAPVAVFAAVYCGARAERENLPANSRTNPNQEG